MPASEKNYCDFMTIRRTITAWLEAQRRTYDEKTSLIYWNSAEHDIFPRLGDVRLTEITPGLLEEFFDDLRALPLNETGLKNAYTVLNGACKYAVEAGFILQSPLLKVERNQVLKIEEMNELKKKTEYFLTDAEADALEGVLLRFPDVENIALYLCLRLGFQLKTICALKWKDIHLDQARIVVSRTIVRADSNKAKGNDRFSIREIAPYTVPISRDVLTVLRLNAPLYPKGDCFVATGNTEFAASFNRLQVLLKSYNRRYHIAESLTVEALGNYFIRHCIECGVSVEKVGSWTNKRYPNQLRKRYGRFEPDDVRLIDRLVASRKEVKSSGAIRHMNLLILGAGDHGHAVVEIASEKDIFDRIAFLDDNPSKEEAIGTCEDYLNFKDEYPMAFPAFGDNELRMKWIDRLEAAGFVIPNLRSPSAYISPTVKISGSCVIEARATIGTGVRIGRGAIISANVTLDAGVLVGEGCYIAPGLTLPKRCEIPDGSTVELESLSQFTRGTL